MITARTHFPDPAVTQWYHRITRYGRRTFLLGEGASDRRAIRVCVGQW